MKTMNASSDINEIQVNKATDYLATTKKCLRRQQLNETHLIQSIGVPGQTATGRLNRRQTPHRERNSK